MPAATSSFTEVASPAPLRFGLICGLLLLLAVWSEPLLVPLNRATAILTGLALQLAGYAPVVRGTLISLDRSTVSIITECTALYAFLLFMSFVLVTPASARQRWQGMLLGGAMLLLANTLRLAVVTVVAAYHRPLFELIHVYLGQVVMLLLVVGCCLVWQRHVARRRQEVAGFLLRCLAWGSLLVVLWLPLNLLYMKLVDAVVVRLFAMLDYQIVIPHQHRVYYQTFNLALFAALMLSERRIAGKAKVYWSALGMAVLAAFHLSFRAGNVMLSAFGRAEALSVADGLVILAAYLLPLLFWLSALRHRGSRSGGELAA